jgi:hypothetical protein
MNCLKSYQVRKMSKQHGDGTGRYWDHEDCLHDDCDGELSQQDRFNVMCLSCERVWTHVKNESKHKLQTADFETVAEKPRVATDGDNRVIEDADSRRCGGYIRYMECQKCGFVSAGFFSEEPSSPIPKQYCRCCDHDTEQKLVWIEVSGYVE